MIHLRVKQRTIQLSSSLIYRGSSTRSKVLQQFYQELKHQHSKNIYYYKCDFRISEFTLRRMIEKYSEQAVYRPIDDMRYFFQYTRRAFVEPGYPPLFYPAVVDGKRDPNKSSVSAIGEGVAGFISQQLYGCRKLARPYKDGVDIIMNSHDVTYLVEAKGWASNENNFHDKLNNEYLERIAIETLSSSGIDIRPVCGLLIGVHLINEVNYKCYITHIETV